MILSCHRPLFRNLPVYLDEDVLGYLRKAAKAKGVEVNELVNDWLKQDIAKAETGK